MIKLFNIIKFLKNKQLERIRSKFITEITRKEFEKIPFRKGFSTKIEDFDSLIILPTKRIHDSGYACMDFIACKKHKPVIKLGGCSDVLHINGIGGYGDFSNHLPDKIKPIGWSIDCLPKSGLLRLFTDHNMNVGADLSSFSVYSSREDK